MRGAQPELLTSEQMAEADRLALAHVARSFDLMLDAGRAVCRATIDLWPDARRVLVFCGPGNNGGDGFVAARLLAEAGQDVRVVLAGKVDDLQGDAPQAARFWGGPIGDAGDLVGGADLIIDALLGSGLSRPVTGPFAEMIDRVNADAAPVLSVDVPSGVAGSTGAVMGTAVRAAATITFFRFKPGHLLLPGRALCGKRLLADIGIPGSVLSEIAPATMINEPSVWLHAMPFARPEGHKYARGHSLVVAGEQTGAARLAARGALRIGAGLVTVASPGRSFDIYAAGLEAVMVRRADDVEAIAAILEDRRINAVVIGPGMEPAEAARAYVETVLSAGRGAVLDAGALSAFAADRERLFSAIQARKRAVVLTPHEGEYARLFSGLDGRSDSDSKLERARFAAKRSGAVVLLKGADTVVADPDGRATIADNAPPWLATAGSGDVLAGMIGGLVAQGMATFEAASAAVWMHGEAARVVGPGLISEDLPAALRPVLSRFH